MPIACDSVDHAVLSTVARGGPYSARSASDRTDNWLYWYVCGPDGRTNVLSFREPFYGAVLTTREAAIDIAAKFNRGAPE